uniref:CIP2A N-terminal domain-containing protein n=1 Tax=Monopterus albus TaxID=43700 RepID=A0A3Q3QYW0_MONAL|nr:protein CIP2A [Monopterus albus]XP_020474523.1 protein CIP2A [Monopterus albus]XP_020474524.1 protein CIP2A [Monopterus albus]
MDLTTCLKSLLLAIHQYSSCRTAQNAAQLQKQVEEVSGLRCELLLSSGQVLPRECVSGLVELVGNPNTSPGLTSSIISMLAHLASDDDSREMLHSSYNFTSALASVIHCHSATPGEPLVLQCLQVLQKLTYNNRVFQSTNYIRELVTFLMMNIQSRNDDIIMPCLGLMANLCRDNRSVQSHIKALDTEELMPFYRTLLSFLSHNSLTVVVFTLSILASLTLNEKVGEKVFDTKNIHQTFQLVFNIIVNGDGTLTRKYSVDLLVDLLKNPKIADFLTRYKHFSACVSQVLGLLQSKDPDSAAKVLELLLAMCSVSGLRLRLCEVLFSRPAGAKCRAVSRIQAVGLDVGHKPESGVTLVQWLSSPVEGAESCSLQALQLLTELLEEALRQESLADGVLSFVEMLLPVLLQLLKGVDPPKGDAHLRKHCRRVTHVTSLLLTMCAEDSTRCFVSAQVSAQFCLSVVESLLSCCHSSSPLTCLPPGSDSDLSQVCAEALLKTLELMSKLRQEVKDMETSFYRMLQDLMIVSALSLALTSHRRDLVQTGLALLFESTALPDFPSLLLGERVAANNAYRRREAELPFQGVPGQKAQAPRTNSSLMDSSGGSSRSVSSLVERMHSGLELQLQEQVKDSQLHEVIDLYEQKFSAFASKESRLQDLLEAKALALSQADRLIGHYRLQQAQAEAEARKLGCLLKEAERQREDLQTELSNQVLEVERLQADMEKVMQRTTRLQEDFEEHQTLKRTYNALLSRFNEGERLLKELQTAHVSLTKQNDTLTRNHEALQQQHEKMASVLEQTKEEVGSLRSDVQQKNSEIADLRDDLRAEEEKVKEKDQKNRDLEETVDVLRKELNKTEQARKSASIKVSSLELQKSQLETKLKQKEEELNKLSAMIGMIHSLSSGKCKNDVNLSL